MPGYVSFVIDLSQKATLYKAMLARDKRFDRHFYIGYIGVRTTGIYCRPVCPARPHAKNVDFYRSAAEAKRRNGGKK